MFIGHLPELILVLVLALIFVGPGKLPAVGAALGKSIAQFKKATSEVEEGIRTSIETPTPVRREQHYLTQDGDEVEQVTTERTSRS
jgi:sec-independent protein translocase protein TatA